MEKQTNLQPRLAFDALLTRTELAEVLRVSTRTIARLVEAHELPAPLRVGHRYRWRMQDVTTFLQGTK